MRDACILIFRVVNAFELFEFTIKKRVRRMLVIPCAFCRSFLLKAVWKETDGLFHICYVGAFTWYSVFSQHLVRLVT